MNDPRPAPTPEQTAHSLARAEQEIEQLRRENAGLRRELEEEKRARQWDTDAWVERVGFGGYLSQPVDQRVVPDEHDHSCVVDTSGPEWVSVTIEPVGDDRWQGHVGGAPQGEPFEATDIDAARAAFEREWFGDGTPAGIASRLEPSAPRPIESWRDVPDGGLARSADGAWWVRRRDEFDVVRGCLQRGPGKFSSPKFNNPEYDNLRFSRAEMDDEAGDGQPAFGLPATLVAVLPVAEQTRERFAEIEAATEPKPEPDVTANARALPARHVAALRRLLRELPVTCRPVLIGGSARWVARRTDAGDPDRTADVLDLDVVVEGISGTDLDAAAARVVDPTPNGRPGVVARTGFGGLRFLVAGVAVDMWRAEDNQVGNPPAPRRGFAEFTAEAIDALYPPTTAEDVLGRGVSFDIDQIGVDLRTGEVIDRGARAALASGTVDLLAETADWHRHHKTLTLARAARLAARHGLRAGPRLTALVDVASRSRLIADKLEAIDRMTIADVRAALGLPTVAPRPADDGEAGQARVDALVTARQDAEPRRPLLPPAQAVDLLQDPVTPASGRLLRAEPIRPGGDAAAAHADREEAKARLDSRSKTE